MTPNELELYKIAAKWVDEKRFSRSYRSKYGDTKYGWSGPEHVFEIWCYDSSLDAGFFLTKEQTKVYTDEELIQKKEQEDKILKEYGGEKDE